jgi:CheY-like chemotaxis protein
VETDEVKVEKQRILHVDDDPEIRLLIAGSLQEFGYVVATAGTVAEALQLAGDLKFDLCILDIKLPDGTGIELCQQLRELQPGVPIVYYSGYAEPVEQREALAVCGDGFLKKPASVSEMQEAIERALAGKSLRD